MTSALQSANSDTTFRTRADDCGMSPDDASARVVAVPGASHNPLDYPAMASTGHSGRSADLWACVDDDGRAPDVSSTSTGRMGAPNRRKSERKRSTDTPDRVRGRCW